MARFDTLLADRMTQRLLAINAKVVNLRQQYWPKFEKGSERQAGRTVFSGGQSPEPPYQSATGVGNSPRTVTGYPLRAMAREGKLRN
jgi:hypothetical protein